MSAEPIIPASAEDPVFTMHRGGKVSVRPTVDVTDRAGLATAYTPVGAMVVAACPLFGVRCHNHALSERWIRGPGSARWPGFQVL